MKYKNDGDFALILNMGVKSARGLVEYDNMVRVDAGAVVDLETEILRANYADWQFDSDGPLAKLVPLSKEEKKERKSRAPKPSPADFASEPGDMEAMLKAVNAIPKDKDV